MPSYPSLPVVCQSTCRYKHISNTNYFESQLHIFGTKKAISWYQLRTVQYDTCWDTAVHNSTSFISSHLYST